MAGFGPLECGTSHPLFSPVFGLGARQGSLGGHFCLCRCLSSRASFFFVSQISFLQCNHTLTANPCSVAKQMRRLQITQFRNRTPPYSRNPICRSPPPTTKQHRPKLATATKSRDLIHSGCWAEQNLIAKCLGIDRCHGDGNEIPTCFPWGARVAQPSWTGRTRRAIPATKLSRYKRTTGLCEE